jgi:glutathione synthase/RimK-type ligase-like ATP-grasp enzyme
MLGEAILVLTQPQDVTASVVVDRLRDIGAAVIQWDSAAFPLRDQLTGRWQGGRELAALHTADGRDVDLRAVRSVWYRRPTEFTFAEGMTEDTLQFARAEARQAFSGLLLASDAVWMNEPRAESVAGLKPLQLKVAQELGLAIPETLITNRPSQAREFLQLEQGDFIYKRLSSMLLYTDDGRLTAFQTERVTEEMLEQIEHVAVTPCLFQRYVPKAYEIRATVVVDRVFAARVDSQATEEGKVDWRMNLDLPWTPYQLPTDIEAQLVELVRRFGLLFGAIDLIRRPDGEYVFLEINPSGQWAWFDDEITHPIRDSIIGVLTGTNPRTASHARASA